MKTQIKHQRKTIIPLLLLGVVVACFGLSSLALATDLGGVLPGNNTADGSSVLINRTTGVNNSGFGFEALKADTSGSYNTATGIRALFSNVTGLYNTADGAFALALNTGNYNTAIGYRALYTNTGFSNTAAGYQALQSNTDGGGNTATGVNALQSNTRGNFNTAIGLGALETGTNGNHNTATGANALLYNTGNNNTATGAYALNRNTTGIDNTADGDSALSNNTTGSNNVALGPFAGASLTTGNGNVCIGTGILGVAGESNTTRIANIYTSVANQRAVYVNSDNKLGTLSSSRRYKEEIKPMDETSEVLFALKPVTFRYKKEVEGDHAHSFGLIAEDVAEISPELITRDEAGKPETVRYEAVNAMLLNEFLKEHRQVQDLKGIVAAQEKAMQALSAQIKQQAAQIEQVSSRLALEKPAATIVLTNR